MSFPLSLRKPLDEYPISGMTLSLQRVQIRHFSSNGKPQADAEVKRGNVAWGLPLTD
jgi:hypothetical protein